MAPQTKSCICSVCSSHVHGFDKLPDYYHEQLDKNNFIFSIFQFETLNWLQYSCPVCGASDRDRLYALYFKREISRIGSESHFLDIAPAKVLQNFIKHTYPQSKYRSADLLMTDVDDRVDVTEMGIYGDNTFDFYICSHVLEHIPDDRKAIRELHRVLKPGGKGIAMAPIILNLDADYENYKAVTPEDRWMHFEQDDHIRMYSKNGFVDKLTSAGFIVHQLDINFFGSDTFYRHGIHPRSVLYITEKLS
jgi:SAM-dependent methyltransferase